MTTIKSTKTTRASDDRRRQLTRDTLLRQSEVPLARAIKNSRNVFIEACAEALVTQNDRSFDGEAIAHRVAVAQLIAQQAALTIPTFGQLTCDEIRTLSAKAMDDGFFARLIDQWTVRQGLARARLIAATSLTDVIKALQAGLEEGEGTDSIARRIRKVSALSAWRAATVARIETHQAALFAQAMTAAQAEEEYGLKLVKRCLPTLDSRTRDAHAAMARHPAIPLKDKFNVGGSPMDRPGDPNGPASQTVNCRCTCTYEEAPS
jgi:hypothetical protein